MSYRALTLAALLVLLPISAQAGCLYKPFEFHPEKNDRVLVEVKVDVGSSCTHNFVEGPGYKFTDISFGREPESGTLVKTGATRFVYTPQRGFTGKDFYVFNICATKGRAEGCSAIYFVSEVKAAP